MCTEMKKIEEYGRLQGLEQGVKQGIEQGVKQGIEQGIEQGIVQGREQGVEQGQRQAAEKTAITMLEDGMSYDLVVKYSRLSLEEVERLDAKRVS